MNMETFGRCAFALEIIWFVMVAGLGIVVSIKNGVLF